MSDTTVRSIQHVKRKIPQPSTIILALLLVVAFFFRFYQIGQVPPGLFPDEATHALDALEVLDGQITIYSPDEGSTGALWRYLLALSFALFGPSVLVLRAFASAVGVASVGMAYLLARELRLSPPAWGEGQESPHGQGKGIGWSEGIAALAALLLAISYWHVDLSRVAFSAVLMLLIQDAAFFCLWRALISGRQRWFVLFGLGLGTLAYSYLPGKLAPAVPLIFFALHWLLNRREALLIKHWHPLLMASGVALVIALPFILFAIFNYQLLAARAAVPTAGAVAPTSPLQGIIANLSTFGLWPTPWLSGRTNIFFLGPILTLCFVIGVGVNLARARRPVYLFLLVWWLVMLLPSALAPEGAIPHPRRAIGIATATFALTSLGLATIASALYRLVARLLLLLTGGPSQKSRAIPLAITLGLGVILAIQTGAKTFQRYFMQWGSSEAAKLAFHVFDLELADLMARESGPETVYLLPLDSAAGSINPLLDSITFVYRGQASYDFLADDERTMAARLAELTANKRIARLLRWKVTKHTGADPKGVAHHYLEKWGQWTGHESFTYFDIETYELGNIADAFAPAVLVPTDISFEGQMALTGYAIGNASGVPVNEPSVKAGELLWVELAWRKTASFSANHQVAIWLEDEAGHVVAQVDKPLLNNLWHQGTGQWAVGAEERGYYLVRSDPATPPGTYWLKAVLYTSDGRRLAPSLPGVGANLAVTLGQMAVHPPLVPPDVTDLAIPERLDLEMGDGLWLLGFDPGFAGRLRPGDRATLKLWWQAQESPTRNWAVVVGIGQGEQVWSLNEPQPLAGADYPTHDWPAGAVVRTRADLRLPPDIESGDYNLGLRLLDMESETVYADWLLGKMEVEGRTRKFEIPSIGHHLGTNFDAQVSLLGYDLDLSQAGEGGPVYLTLYWQAQREMETAYKVFVHLLNESGQIVTQVDREPQAGEAPTTGWLAGEVVVDEIEIPVTDALVTTRSIAIGLYDPSSGKRLPMLDTDGSVFGDSVTFAIP